MQNQEVDKATHLEFVLTTWSLYTNSSGSLYTSTRSFWKIWGHLEFARTHLEGVRTLLEFVCTHFEFVRTHLKFVRIHLKFERTHLEVVRTHLEFVRNNVICINYWHPLLYKE